MHVCMCVSTYIMYGYNFNLGLLRYVETWNFEVLSSWKVLPEDKELYSICLGHYQRLYQLSLIATEL